MLFHKIEGATLILLSKGVYRQVDTYQRNGEVFARWGSGFIGVRYSGFGGFGTSLPHVSVIDTDGLALVKGRHGPARIEVEPVARAA